jgi:hypothetical protein
MEIMMTTTPRIWDGLPRVIVTTETIDRALKAMVHDKSNPNPGQISIRGAILAGTIIAYINAFDEEILDLRRVCAVVDEALGFDYLSDWVADKYGLKDPRTAAKIRKVRAQAKLKAARSSSAKVARAAKRETGIPPTTNEHSAPAA